MSAPDPVRESTAESAQDVLGAAIGASLSLRLSVDEIAAAGLRALTAAGYAVVQLPPANPLRISAGPYAIPSGEFVALRWFGSTLPVGHARQLVADVLASIDDIEGTEHPAACVRESVTPTDDGGLIVDCTVHGEIGTVPGAPGCGINSIPPGQGEALEQLWTAHLASPAEPTGCER